MSYGFNPIPRQLKGWKRKKFYLENYEDIKGVLTQDQKRYWEEQIKKYPLFFYAEINQKKKKIFLKPARRIKELRKKHNYYKVAIH